MAHLKASYGTRQSLFNYASTCLGFALTVLIGIWFTPYLVGRIGPASYGLVMLAAVVVSYAGPLAQSLSATLAREFSAAAENGDAERLQQVMSSSLRLCLRLALGTAAVLVPLSLAGPYLFGIAPEFRGEQSLILLLTSASLLIWMFSAPFGAVLYVANRIDHASYAAAAQNVARVLGAVVLIEWLGLGSYAVPAAAIAGALVGLLVAVLAAALVSRLTLSGGSGSGTIRLSLGRTGFGLLLGSIATVLLLGTELLIVNHLVDEAEAGRYAAVVQIPTLIRAAILNLSAMFGPAILSHYTRNELSEACAATAAAIRTLGVSIALPVGVGLAAAPLILEIWLGRSFVHLTPVLRLGLAGSVIFAAASPLYHLSLAAGRTRWPAMFRFLSVAIYVTAAVVLFKATDLGLAGVALGLAIGLTLSELVFMAPYAAKIGGAPRTAFLTPFIPVIAAVALAYSLSSLLLLAWTPASIFDLCLSGALVAVPYAAAGLLLIDRGQAGVVLPYVTALIRVARRTIC